MSDIVIQAKNLSKQYRLGMAPDAYKTLRDALAQGFKIPFKSLRKRADPLDGENSIWALRDVNFEVRQGQVLGIIGRNGAGKSTLLKILSRITEPTEGEVIIRGRVGSLLEVGTGFHPELTGKENIFLNGAILGMHRWEIEKKYDEIVEFSGVEKFIDTPVKRYSSGMHLRLAFSVAAHLEPEILVVDEVLAVGDAEFQRKCIGKMSDVASEGRTVLFVSHSMSSVLRLTQETIVMNKGQIEYRAPSPEAVDYYLSTNASSSGERVWSLDEIPANAAPFKPGAVRILNQRGEVVDTVRSIEPFMIEVVYELEQLIPGLRVGLYLTTMRGENVLTTFDIDAPEMYQANEQRHAGRYVSRCSVPANLLNTGHYAIGLNASTYRVRRYFQDERVLTFSVDTTGAPGTQWDEPRPGPVRPQFSWEIVKI